MPRVGARLAARAVRRGLARAGVAAGARRAQRDADAADDLFRGDVAPRDHPQREPAGPRHHRPVDQRLRHARAEGAVPRPDAARRDLVVPRHERAGRGQRPREPEDARRARSATSSSSTGRRCGRRARTTPTGASASCAPTRPSPKHKGISALIIDTTSPGVERRPFPELTDPEFCDFNEVFFTDVRVPEGEPRRSAQRRLADHAGFARARARDALDRATRTTCSARCSALVELGDRPVPGGGRLGDDPRFRDAVAGFYVDAQALLAMGYRGFSKFLHGKSSPEHSLLKLFGSESLQTALLFGTRSARHRRARTLERLGPQMWREGSWAISVPALVRRHDPRRHERDPAQHHRRACARASRDSCRRASRLHAAFAGAEHAELVAFGIGEHDPADVALADVDHASRRAPTSRSTSASWSSGTRSMCSRFFTVFASGTGTNTRPGNDSSCLVITTSSSAS